MDRIHDFQESLHRSHRASDDPFWAKFYEFHFPNNLGIFALNENGQPQYLGVDRLVLLPSGKALYVDEKTRFCVYEDIAIEYVSSDIRQTPGWAEKPLMCDYIAYAFFPERSQKKAYLLPVPQLQSVWKMNKRQWLNTYGTRNARNNGYKTLFCPVPWNVLRCALLGGLEFIEEEDIPF